MSTSSCGGYAASNVIAFPSGRSRRHRFSPVDRFAIIRWTEQASRHGNFRVDLHEDVGDDPDFGDFLLIYRDDGVWAEWGVACGRSRYSVWRPSNGATVGVFYTMHDALEALTPLD